MTAQESIQGNPVSRASLPAAAQRWLERALPQHLDLPSSILIEQEGTMDIRGKWTPFTAKGTYKASPYHSAGRLVSDYCLASGSSLRMATWEVKVGEALDSGG